MTDAGWDFGSVEEDSDPDFGKRYRATSVEGAFAFRFRNGPLRRMDSPSWDL
jgi:hypothetical protein